MGKLKLQAPLGKLVGVSLTVLILDQVTKMVIWHVLPLHHSISVIPGFFNLTHIHNPGGAFGFLAAQSTVLRNVLFICFSILATGLIVYFYFQTPSTHRWLQLGFALVCGGAIGNLIDRLRLGKVIDFLDFFVGSWHWPAFNVADSAITIGMLILLVHLVSNRMP